MLLLETISFFQAIKKTVPPTWLDTVVRTKIKDDVPEVQPAKTRSSEKITNFLEELSNILKLFR